MAQYLVIRLGDEATDTVGWIAVDDQGTRRGHPGSGSLQDAAREIRDNAVVVLVPATDVLSVTVDIPAKGGARLRAALPYALEDQLADDVDELHFAHGAKLDNGRWPVAVVRRDRITEWLERLADAGIEADSLVPENHGLALTPNTMSLLVSGNVVMFNDGADTQFALPDLRPSEAVAAAGLLDAEDDSPARHLLAYCDAASGDEYEKDWALLRHELSSVDVNLLPDGALPRLAVTVAAGAGINLLQGRYGPRTEVGQYVRPWRVAAMFLLAFGVIALLGKGADFYRVTLERERVLQQFGAEYCDFVPGATCEVVDPIGIVRSLQRSVGSDSTATAVFLPSLMQLADALQQNPDVRVEALSYRAGVVTVRMNAPDIPALDRVVQVVANSGRFRATMQDATTVGDRVNSRVEIREEGA